MATIVVVALAGLFTYLGLWQLNRHNERIAENAEASVQLGKSPVPIQELSESSPRDVEFRRVTVEGQWNTDEEILIRSQVHLGQAGFHVITPLEFGGGAVLVNRGWVPLTMDTTPVDADPTAGKIEGWVRLSQERAWLGREEPPGELTVFNRVDVNRIQQQVTADLIDFYIVHELPDEGQLPAPVDLPAFEDDGPHLAYAIQWFGFALVGLIGFGFLARRKAS